MLFAISSKFDGRWERILLSQFLKTSCIESFHLVELFCKFMTFLSWLMGFGKIILHQKGAVMNSFYFFSYLFRFVHFFLKFAPMGNILRVINQRIVDTLKDPELILGQSYFIPPKSEEGYVWDFNKFKNQFNFVLLPTLKEYSFNESSAVNSIIGENLGDGIQETDEFKAAFAAEFAS